MISGAVAVGAEILFEKLSGGIKFGGKTLDEGATKALSRNLSNRIIRSILKWTGNALLEGGEGYLTDATTNVVRKLTYADDKTWKEIFWSEEALDSFIGEMIIGGGFSGYDAVNSHVNGRDYAAGLTANEEKLVRQEYEKHIAEAMEKGQKLSAADKNKIWEAAVEEILGNQAAISEIGKSGWDGRVAVEPVTGPKVTVGGKTYELIGYDKDVAKVYQDAEVLKEQAEAESKQMEESESASQAEETELEGGPKAEVKDERKAIEKTEDGDIITTTKGIGIQFFANKGIQRQSNRELRKSMDSWKSRLDEHAEWVNNPQLHDQYWDEKTPQHKAGLIKHWQHEIDNFKNNLKEAEDELRKRGEK